jgi:transposase
VVFTADLIDYLKTGNSQANLSDKPRKKGWVVKTGRPTAVETQAAKKQGMTAQVLTDQHTDDPSQVGPLLDQVEEKIGKVTADGAYDGTPTYQTIAQYGDNIEAVIPPRSTALPSTGSNPQSQRDRHLEMINTQGRLAWQTATGYGQRALVETTMGRYKSLIGPSLRARGFEAQQTEAAIGVQVLNRMLSAGRPNSVRCKRRTA